MCGSKDRRVRSCTTSASHSLTASTSETSAAPEPESSRPHRSWEIFSRATASARPESHTGRISSARERIACHSDRASTRSAV
ncbi:Uncharacterised protein [Mycobacteroides abscessus]|nr:Uncharacterised protein [Mycobacteroides abscessus]